MAKNGKQKGAEFERRICKTLSSWIESETVVFWRSAMSGGSATVAHKKGISSEMGGDLVAIGDTGAWLTNKFSIECKSYADFSFELLMQNRGTIPKWWEQCCQDADRDGKKPLMIFKKNRSPIYVAFNQIDVNGMYNYCAHSLNTTRVTFDVSKQPMQIFLLDDWLSQTDFESFKGYCNGLGT